MPRHIAINGELGSGKSTVARRVADTLRMHLISTGDIHRSIAASLRLSTLETNLRAEYDQLIDEQVDSVTLERALSEDPIVFDSRLAWKLIPSALKVHLVVDPTISANRLHAARHTVVEDYVSIDDARMNAEKRYQSEYRRFLAKYDADVSRLRNYNLIIDTSDAAADRIAQNIVSAYRRDSEAAADLYVSPRRILPTSPSDDIRFAPSTRPQLAYSRPFFYAISCRAGISEAIRKGAALMKADLVAEAAEEVKDGVSAAEYFPGSVDRETISAWELSNGIVFDTLPF